MSGSPSTLTPEVAARLWASVDKSGDCWVWTGSRRRRGYGQITVQGANVATHRLSWMLANGPIPDGLYVCHRCDNPPCVRTDHLFLGTHADNMADVAAKGTRLRTVCKRGHPLVGDNIKPVGRWRQCKTCHTDWMHKWRQRLAADKEAERL